MKYTKYLITGGAGFIGSHMVRNLAVNPKNDILVVDKLTYAANLSNIKNALKNKNCRLSTIDICNYKSLKKCFFFFKPDIIINFAAESHVDKSIDCNLPFLKSNVIGTYNLLECYRNLLKHNSNQKNKSLFLHVSTDEVYGDLKKKKFFTEKTRYDPSSPYSSTKASSDMLVSAWSKTYKIPCIISNCSNNFGSHQHPEKLIPHMIISALQGKNLPVYGDGKQIRDWIDVDDHIKALRIIIKKGKIGEHYNIGGNNTIRNIQLIRKICNILDFFLKKKKSESFLKKIIFVNDRPAHDTKYAVCYDKISKELGWRPSTNFDHKLKSTIKWYLDNETWWKNTINKKYKLKRIGLIK